MNGNNSLYRLLSKDSKKKKQVNFRVNSRRKPRVVVICSPWSVLAFIHCHLETKIWRNDAMIK